MRSLKSRMLLIQSETMVSSKEAGVSKVEPKEEERKSYGRWPKEHGISTMTILV
jgi:hypothetical protein